MTEIPQPVNVQPYQSPMTPTTPTGNPRDHGLRIDVPMQAPMQEQAPAEDISPLTPRTSHERSRDEQPVSPIEPATSAQARAPLADPPFQSQIPRKVTKSIESGERARTKWDEYSGEPTQDETGKSSSVRPGAQPVEMQYPHLKERTKQILASLREREAEKKKTWGKVPPPVSNDPLDNPPERQPWKGASGRAAIVEPVRNTPAARQGPIQPPERSVHRVKAFHSPTEAAFAQCSSPATHSIRSVASEENIKPIVPLKSAKRNISPGLTTNKTTQGSSQSPELHHSPLDIVPGSSQPRVESPQYDPEPTTPTTPTCLPEPHLTSNTSDLSASYGQVDLEREQSRFSWTTYTTSAVESPRSLAQAVREASPPPIQALPLPITIRKRPVSTSPFLHSSPYMHQIYADSTASMVSRKPLPSIGSRAASISTATSRAASTSKSLPPTPTIMEAADKMENLDAQLEGLNRRKHNILRIIRDLEESLRKNAVTYDMWKRREVEKNITNHKLELDDIGSEIHEISLRLHRAQRKRDREDGYEACTGLWIKRITS